MPVSVLHSPALHRILSRTGLRQLIRDCRHEQDVKRLALVCAVLIIAIEQDWAIDRLGQVGHGTVDGHVVDSVPLERNRVLMHGPLERPGLARHGPLERPGQLVILSRWNGSGVATEVAKQRSSWNRKAK